MVRQGVGAPPRKSSLQLRGAPYLENMDKKVALALPQDAAGGSAPPRTLEAFKPGAMLRVHDHLEKSTTPPAHVLLGGAAVLHTGWGTAVIVGAIQVAVSHAAVLNASPRNKQSPN